MANTTLYIMAKQNVAVAGEDVELSDVASVYCEDAALRAKADALRIHRFRKGQPERVVISMLRIIELLTELCSGITVESIGETDIIIEKASLEKDKPRQKKGIGEIAKIVFVALICFFGSGFTIMAFHNDIGISDVLGRIYELVTGTASDGCTSLEISYSVGLAAGIIIFYNHVGGRRLTSDPTPLEVEMRNYERDVNQAIVEMADRQKLEEDVSK
ncbi:MAG: stage V sporulation protein AA [Roseburia sp.]|nr:stage V sporulation protein AA [Roseburia sp.]